MQATNEGTPVVLRESDSGERYYVCGACKAPLIPHDKFCAKCGKKTNWMTEEERMKTLEFELDEKWISTQEMVPIMHRERSVFGDDVLEWDVSDPVLVFADDEIQIGVLEYDVGEPKPPKWLVGDDEPEEVTHWMPLPKKPKQLDGGAT